MADTLRRDLPHTNPDAPARGLAGAPVAWQVWHMDPNLLQLLICAGLTLVGIVITAIIWKRAAVRTILWWIGLALIPIAIYLVGLVPLLIDGWDTLVKWYGMLTVTPVAMVGASLGGLGVLLMLVSRLVPYRKRSAATGMTPAVTGAAQPARPLTPRAPAAASNQPRHQPTPTQEGELDEVTEILRRRGIE